MLLLSPLILLLIPFLKDVPPVDLKQPLGQSDEKEPFIKSSLFKEMQDYVMMLFNPL